MSVKRAVMCIVCKTEDGGVSGHLSLIELSSENQSNIRGLLTLKGRVCRPCLAKLLTKVATSKDKEVADLWNRN